MRFAKSKPNLKHPKAKNVVYYSIFCVQIANYVKIRAKKLHCLEWLLLLVKVKVIIHVYKMAAAGSNKQEVLNSVHYVINRSVCVCVCVCEIERERVRR